MQQIIITGNLGAPAQQKNENGREFLTFRVGHNDRWTDQTGQIHESTQWYDCIMSGTPKVAQFLLQGTQVMVIGIPRYRVYSSEKERCMKCGVSISVTQVELIGSKTDAVPSRLYDSDGVAHDVAKFYHTDVTNATLLTQRGTKYQVDANGWVNPTPVEPSPNASTAPIVPNNSVAGQSRQRDASSPAPNDSNEPDRSGNDAPAL